MSLGHIISKISPLQSQQSHGMFCSLLNKENTYVNKKCTPVFLFISARIDSRLLYDKQSFHCTEKICDGNVNIFLDVNLRDSQSQMN